MNLYFILHLHFLYLILFVNGLHLNNYQIKSISNLIQHPNLSQRERKVIHFVLYNAYEKWAIKKAVDFKLLHKYKCENVNMDELVLASKIGLFKSIQKYNGKYNFINYSSFYVRSELLKVLTDVYSLSILPKKYRTKSKTKINGLNDKTHLLRVKLFGVYKQWQLDEIIAKDEDILHKIHTKYDFFTKMNEILHDEVVDADVDVNSNSYAFVKRIIYLKFYLRQNNTKRIAELMGCSDETIRKKIQKYPFL